MTQGSRTDTPAVERAPAPARDPVRTHPAPEADESAASSTLTADFGTIPLFDPMGVPSLPPDARAPLQNEGRPVDSAVARNMSTRLGVDLQHVRIHDDATAARATRSLGASAFSYGHHVVLGPTRAVDESKILAHELTHVAQQTRGSIGSEAQREFEADRAERGQTPFVPRGGPPQPSLHLRPGDALSLTITTGEDERAGFAVEIEGGETLHAVGRAAGLEPGTYQVVMATDEMHIYDSEGTALEPSSNFYLHVPASGVALVQALRRATSRIPLYVTEGVVPEGSETEGRGAGTPLTARERIEALPENIREFLFTEGGPAVRSADYETILRIAERLADLTQAELDEYAARTTGSTSSWELFEESINRWLVELRERREAHAEYEEATRRLYGMDEIYEMYRSLAGGGTMYGYYDLSSFVGEYEPLPVSALREEDFVGGSALHLYYRLRVALEPHGFANVTQFSQAILRFAHAFRESAYYNALNMLDRAEHLLLEQRERYADAAETEALYESLSLPRWYFEDSDIREEEARANYGSSWDPAAVLEYHRRGDYIRRVRERGRMLVRREAGTHPLLGQQAFPTEELARSSREDVGSVMGRYIRETLGKIQNTRERLQDDHELIFTLDLLVRETMSDQGIEEGSIWSQIIHDYNAPSVDDMFVEMALIALAIGAGLVSGGTGTIAVLGAVVSLGLSSYFALREYEDYARRRDAYGAELLSEEPELIWVVIAVAGVVLDLAAVSRVIRPLRPALRNFQRTGDIVELERELRLARVNDEIRESILRGAELERRSRAAWRSVLRPGYARASLFGADIVAQVSYAIYLNLRRGINSFNRWVLTREAVSLIGDIAHLSPADLTRLKAVYAEANAGMQRIASHGRSIGMADDEIDEVLRLWAETGEGSVDDVIARMGRAAPDAPGHVAPIARSRFPREVSERVLESYPPHSARSWTRSMSRDMEYGEYVYVVRDVDTDEILKVGKTSHGPGSDALDRRMSVYRNAAELTDRNVQVELHRIDPGGESTETYEGLLRSGLYDEASGEGAARGFEWDNMAPHNRGRVGPGTPGELPTGRQTVEVLEVEGDRLLVRMEDGVEQWITPSEDTLAAVRDRSVPWESVDVRRRHLYEWRSFEGGEWRLVYRGSEGGAAPRIPLVRRLRTMDTDELRETLTGLGREIAARTENPTAADIVSGLGEELGLGRSQVYEWLRRAGLSPSDFTGATP